MWGRTHSHYTPWAVRGAAGFIVLAVWLAAAPAKTPGQGAPVSPGNELPPLPEPSQRYRPAESLGSGFVFPYPGLQIILGDHFLSVRSDKLNKRLGAGGGFSDGASVGLDWVGEIFRVGYLRQTYRNELPKGTTFRLPKGTTNRVPVNLLAIDADQIWAYAGLRAWRRLYLGGGLGVQKRRIRLTPGIPLTEEETKFLEIEESLYSVGFMLEYAFALPFFLQIRHTVDLPGQSFEMSGQTLILAYIIPL